jgi:hypothetical protein
MLNTIVILVIGVILFALCLTQDKALDAERDFWIKYSKLRDQLSSQDDVPHL